MSGNFLIFGSYTYIKTTILGGFALNKMDIDKLLSAISKMDKEELEKNIYKAQKILESSNIQAELNKKED